MAAVTAKPPFITGFCNVQRHSSCPAVVRWEGHQKDCACPCHQAPVAAGEPAPRPPASRSLPDIDEASWQDQVIQLARLCGWKHQHQYYSRRSVAGWPDLILCRPPRLLAVELKTRTGKVTPAQQQWLDLLNACGVEVFVWRPADIDQVRAVLARRHPAAGRDSALCPARPGQSHVFHPAHEGSAVIRTTADLDVPLGPCIHCGTPHTVLARGRL